MSTTILLAFLLSPVKAQSLPLYRYDKQEISSKYKKALSTSLAHAYSICPCKEPLELYAKQEYRKLTTSKQRKLISNSYIIAQIIIDKEIKYVWYF